MKICDTGNRYDGTHRCLLRYLYLFRPSNSYSLLIFTLLELVRIMVVYHNDILIHLNGTVV